jgi:carboxypeptidase Taq
MTDIYDKFVKHVERIENLKEVMGILHWDQEVMMPTEGVNARSKQFAVLSAMRHELVIDEEFGEMINEVSKENDEDIFVICREVERSREREIAIPTELVEELAMETSNAFPIWVKAKKELDFRMFENTLKKMVSKKCEVANYINPSADPYETLFEDYEPYLGILSVEKILEELRKELVPLIKKIRNSGGGIGFQVEEEFDIMGQENLSRKVLDLLGYDWSRGRLDLSPHPFSMGNYFDSRITTRFRRDNLIEGLLSTIHEFGHALYTLNLPMEYYGTPLCDDMGMIIHESQSRFWENHIGRSPAFWDKILPMINSEFPGKISLNSDEMYQVVNRVKLDNPIRVNADELTYHMHIIIRYEIESGLIGGELNVSEIPMVWEEKMEKYLGVIPKNDSEGCLQDIHWSHGSFGYFPTYSVGSVLAAQVNHAMETDIGSIQKLIRQENFECIREWLRENIHNHGGRYTTPDLIEVATNEPIKIDYFVKYVKEKYSGIYGI